MGSFNERGLDEVWHRGFLFCYGSICRNSFPYVSLLFETFGLRTSAGPRVFVSPPFSPVLLHTQVCCTKHGSSADVISYLLGCEQCDNNVSASIYVNQVSRFSS